MKTLKLLLLFFLASLFILTGRAFASNAGVITYSLSKTTTIKLPTIPRTVRNSSKDFTVNIEGKYVIVKPLQNTISTDILTIIFHNGGIRIYRLVPTDKTIQVEIKIVSIKLNKLHKYGIKLTHALYGDINKFLNSQGQVSIVYQNKASFIDGQKQVFSSQNNIPYYNGYKVIKKAPQSVEPNIKYINDGISAAVKPYIVGGNKVSVQFHILKKDITGWQKVSSSGGTYKLPSVHIINIKNNVVIPSGKTAIADGIVDGNRRELLVLITPTVTIEK